MAEKKYKLLIDHREGEVLKHKDVFEQINHEKRTLTTGDYSIIYGGHIIACFERKTYADFADSIKDKRMRNKDKMIKLREETGCRLYYLIEGTPFVDISSKVNSIPYRNIESSIFHMMIRDDIMIIYTGSSRGTAEYFQRFMVSMNNMSARPCDFYQMSQFIGAGEEKTESDSIARLKEHKEKPLSDIVKTIWCSIPRVGPTLAANCYNKVTLREVLTEAGVDKLLAIDSGRKFPKNVIASLRDINAQTEIAMLASMQGISDKTARILLRERRLGELLDKPKEEVAELMLGERKLGKALADKIFACFFYAESS